MAALEKIHADRRVGASVLAFVNATVSARAHLAAAIAVAAANAVAGCAAFGICVHYVEGF